MIRLIRFVIVLALLIGGLGFILFQAFKFLGLTRWSRSRREREMKEGVQKAAAQLDNPVAWKVEEFDLLSQSLAQSVRKGVFSIEKSGYFKTIYGETYIGYYIKEYSSQQYLLCLATNKDKIVLTFGGAQADVVFNGEKMGAYRRGQYFDTTGTLIGSWEEKDVYTKLTVSGVEVGHLERWDGSAVENARAFSLVEEDKIDQKDILPFTVLTLMYLLEKEGVIKKT